MKNMHPHKNNKNISLGGFSANYPINVSKFLATAERTPMLSDDSDEEVLSDCSQINSCNIWIEICGVVGKA